MMKDKEKTILKLKSAFDLGYYPSRFDESYVATTADNYKIYDLINCMSHACFNLTNDILSKIHFNYHDTLVFGDFYYMEDDCMDDNCVEDYYVEDECSVIEKSVNMMVDFVKKVGLQIQPSNTLNLQQPNEWNIALYLNSYDYHFLLQEKSKIWSSKFGKNKDLEFFNELPNPYKHAFLPEYKLHGIYTIANPNYKGEKSIIKSEKILNL